MIDSVRDTPLYDVAVETRRQRDARRDLMADTRRVSFALTDPEWLWGKGEAEPQPTGLSLLVDLDEGVEAYHVTDHAHGQIGGHLGVPARLYNRLRVDHPDLFSTLVNGLLYREPAKRRIRTLDGKARAFLSDMYRPRDNWDLLEQAIVPALSDHPGDVTFKACELTETRMYVKVVLPDFERPITPREGDVIRGGLIVRNSEVGSSALTIAPYTDRLICRNGMVHTEYGKGQRHVGGRIQAEAEAYALYSNETLALDDKAFYAKCRDVVKATLNETVFDLIVAQMRDLAGMKIGGDVVAAVEIVADRHDLTGDERSSMLSAMIDGADRSAWGIVNAITQTARDLPNPDRRVDLETLAGRMVSDPSLLAGVAA